MDSARPAELRSRLWLALFAGALALLWALAGPRTPDLAAATYRVNLFRDLGFLVLDEHWYAGHDLPGYSLLFPPLGALLGLRVVGALALVCSSVLFERLLRPVYGSVATWGAAAFTLAAAGDVWSGRVAFALGVPFGLAALLCLRQARASQAPRATALVLAIACAAASPVAGALLGLAALTLSLHERRPGPFLTLALPAGILVLALALLFPEGGYEPFPLLSFLASFVVGLLFVLALPRRPASGMQRLAGALPRGPALALLRAGGVLQGAPPSGLLRLGALPLRPAVGLLRVGGLLLRPPESRGATLGGPSAGRPASGMLRLVAVLPRRPASRLARICVALRPPVSGLLALGGVLYLLACLVCLLIRTPVGSNVERYGVLLATPLLLCETLSRGTLRPPRDLLRRNYSGSLRSLRSSLLTATGLAWIALVAGAVWVLWGPVRESTAVAGSPATSASYYVPLERFLAGVERRTGPVRVEVPLTRSHWEAALLAPDVALARGWEKQLEERYDGALLESSLTAASYRRWLRAQAISYVALPDVALDGSSAAEGRVIHAGLPYLREVFASKHWRLYRVLGATPLASGPGALTSLGHAGFTLRAERPGAFLVRVHYSRYWGFARGAGCITPASNGWTRVRVDTTGTSVIRAGFTLSRAIGTAGACSRGVLAR